MTCFNARQYQVPVLLICLLFAKSSQGPKSWAQSLIGAGLAHGQQSDNRVIEDLMKSLMAATTEEERTSLLAEKEALITTEFGRLLNDRGNRLRLDGNYPEALKLFELSRAVSKHRGDVPGVADAQNNIGNIYRLQGKYPQALALLENSLSLSKGLGDRAREADALNHIGVVNYWLDKYDVAMKFYQGSLPIYEELGHQAGIAQTNFNLCNLLRTRGNSAQAINYCRKSLTIYETLGNKEGIGAALHQIGIVVGANDSAQGLDYLQKSLTVSRELDDRLKTAQVLQGIGNIYSRLGDHPKALESYQESLKIRKSVGDRQGAAGLLNNIGSIYAVQSNLAEALKYYQQSLKMNEELGDRYVSAHTMGRIAELYRKQGNLLQSIEYFQKGLDLARELGLKGTIADFSSGIGGIYHRQGDHAAALEHLQRALALYKEVGRKNGIAQNLNRIGNVYSRQGNYALALEHYEQSLVMQEALGNKEGIAIALDNMSLLKHRQGDYGPSLDLALRSSAVAKEISFLNTQWRADLRAGLAYQALKRPAEALQAFESAINTVEVMRDQVAGGEIDRQIFFEGLISPYYAAVELLVEQGRDVAAFDYAERAKARVLLDIISQGGNRITKSITLDERERESRLQRELLSLNTQFAGEAQKKQPDQSLLAQLKERRHRARLEYEAFQTALYNSHPELKVKRGEASTLSLTEATAMLPDAKSVLLEFVVAENKSYLFVLTKGSGSGAAAQVKVYPLGVKGEELVDRAKSFRQQLAKRDPRFRETARSLYDLLLGPAQKELSGKSTLVIVPDGVLWELPFQALLTPAGRYLLEDSSVSYAPSLTVLRETRKARRWEQTGAAGAQTLLAFGNPAFGKETVERVQLVNRDEKLEPLPEAEREVKTLERLYGAGRGIAYTGPAAREDRFKADAGKYRVLHLATHGILNDASPMYSHLVLAQGEGGGREDGLLEAWELMNLDLHTDLVVLSACETARGRVGAGEGVIGLSWALFVAGSPTTVVSLWKVDSASTTELMLEFHRNLRPKGSAPASAGTTAEALRRASLKLMRDERYKHPFYWAGFVVVGKG